MNLIRGKLIYYISLIATLNRERVKQDTIEAGVRETIKDYGKTLKNLELYDKGKISKPKSLARYSSLREYIQHI